jgi:hypothetical protein
VVKRTKGRVPRFPSILFQNHVCLAGINSAPGFFPVAFDSWQLAGGGVSHGKCWS